MIALAFVACLGATPAVCREETLLYVDMTVMACVVRGQAELAAWAVAHPDWEIRSWLCEARSTEMART